MNLQDGVYYFESAGILPSLIKGLDKVFNSLWPALKQILYLKKDPSSLEVIPKICEYDLPPGVLHEGHWHGEGTNADEIVAGAVHYLNVDPEIEGGALRFRPVLSSYSSFASGWSMYGNMFLVEILRFMSH